MFFIDFFDRNSEYNEDGDGFCGFDFHVGYMREDHIFSISITLWDWAVTFGIDFEGKYGY